MLLCLIFSVSSNVGENIELVMRMFNVVLDHGFMPSEGVANQDVCQVLPAAHCSGL